MSETKARELLAAEYEREGMETMARLLRSGQNYDNSDIAINAIVRALQPASNEEMVEAAFREAYELGFLEGYECIPRGELNDPEQHAAARLGMDGLAEAWSDYKANLPTPPASDTLAELREALEKLANTIDGQPHEGHGECIEDALQSARAALAKTETSRG